MASEVGPGTSPVDRSNPRASLKSMSEGARIIAERRISVLLFPEGGRSPHGLREFKEGAAYIAIKAGVPVVPVALVGMRELLPMGSVHIRSGRVTVRVGDPIPTAGLKLGAREELTARLHRRDRRDAAGLRRAGATLVFMIRAARRLALTWSLLSAVALAVAFASPADPWLRIRSANFELFTTAGERSGRDLLRHFEQVRGFFLQVFGLRETDAKPVRIVAFHSEKEFQPYRPSEAATAFFHAGSEHDYIVMSNTDPEHYQVATHEYTHLLIGQFHATMPVWLNEGLAELYSTLQQVGDKVVVGMPPPGRGQCFAPRALDPSRHAPLYRPQFAAIQREIARRYVLRRELGTGRTCSISTMTTARTSPPCWKR